MALAKLSQPEIAEALKGLEGWKEEQGAIQKKFIFKDFKEALAFMNKVGEEAEKLNHHPDWSNSYNKVHISLHTHSIQGLSRLDIQLAKTINSLL